VRRINPLALLQRAGRPAWRVLWATTFEFDLDVFDEHVLRLLGEQCEATILVDPDWMARFLERVDDPLAIDGGAGGRWRHVNRDYLLRSPRAGRLFHPKTYLMATEDEGLLLVGSGNLTLSGLASGHELFVPFWSTDPGGRQAILAWRTWVEDLVSASGDDLLQSRLRELKTVAGGWLLGIADENAFRTNRDRHLADALLDALIGPVDKLTLAAPFLDPGAQALEQLIERARPEHTVLHLSPGTSVHGPALRRVIEQAQCPVEVLELSGGSGFVHAKVIGVTGQWGAQALVGSANLSLAALWSAYQVDAGANVEAAAIVSLSREELEEILVPPGLATRPVPLEEIEGLSVREEDPEPPARPLRLDSALLIGDELRLSPSPPPIHDGSPVKLATPIGFLPIAGGSASGAAPLASRGALVWLADAGEAPLSARVPITSPAALAARTAGGRRDAPGAIPELSESDLQESELGRLLAWLDANYIFDIDATGITERVARALELRDEEAADVDQAQVEWDLLREAVLLDRRAARYGRLGRSFPNPIGGDSFDPELAAIAIVVSRIPGLSALAPPAQGSDEPHEEAGRRTGHAWSFERRRELRFANAIERFARAHADPRNAAVHPEAPSANFAALVEVLWALWVLDHQGRPEVRLPHRTALFSTLLLTFDGYLSRLEASERLEAGRAVPKSARSLAAALVYLALRDGARWESVLFDWQEPIKRLAFELDVLSADEDAAAALEDIGVTASASDIAGRLEWAALFDDESYWASRLAERLRLQKILVRPMPQRPLVPFDLVVEGLSNPLMDPRTLRLITETCLRDARGFAVIANGQTVARAMPREGGVELALRRQPEDRRLTPIGTLSRERLRAAVEEGVALGDLVRM
jgi:hypothetical protein